MIVTNDLSFNGNLNIGQTVYTNNIRVGRPLLGIAVGTNANSQLDISGTTILRGNLIVTNDVSFNGNLSIGQNIYTNELVGTGPSAQLDLSGSIRIIDRQQNISALQVGITSTNSINVYGSMTANNYNRIAGTNDVGVIWGTGSGTQTGNLVIAPFNTTNSYGLKVSRDGKIGINTNNSVVQLATLEISGNLIVRGDNNRITGNLYAGNVEAYIFNATSDYRVKENPILLNQSFFVDDLKPMFYKNKLSNRDDMGFLAHEVQEVFPFLVNGEKDADRYQSVNYNGFIALLVKEIQDLKKRVYNLENKNV